MRISQLNSLTEVELSLLLALVTMQEVISGFKLNKPSDVLWIKHDALIAKLNRHESALTDEGKEVFKGLMAKLTMTPEQEREAYEHSTKPVFTQSEFQF